MFNLFRKNKKLPDFDFIKSYSEREKYFVRAKKWKWLNSDQITLLEIDSDNKIKMTTMEYWFQEMFLDADGQKTISDYLIVLIKQFKDNGMKIPIDLDKFMVETLLSLKNELHAIEFNDSPIEINTDFKNPIED